MIRFLAAVAIAAVASTGAVPAGQPVAPHARLPGFAAALAERPFATGPAAWPATGYRAAWDEIATGTPATRQEARWHYATALIAAGRGGDALGVLDVMVGDDPDLTLVPAWRRAHGVALALLGRPVEALAALADGALVDDAESCLWRMRVLAEAGQAGPALGQLDRAMPALNARRGPARRPFVLAAARAALTLGRYRPVLAWLAALPDGDPAANVLRGRAHLALGTVQEGRLRLDRVAISGDAQERADATLSRIEADAAAHLLPPADAIARLDRLAFSWRGGDIETRALTLSMRLAIDAHDATHALSAGAALFRYHDLGAGTAPLVTTLQRQLATVLAPGTTMPLPQSAGLFWDYRDLVPSGIEGDRMVESLVRRLQSAGLYARAADLLQHRLASRGGDIEQGPLSVRIASLYILAGTPDRAVRVLRATDGIPFPAEMQADRRRTEAAALSLLGKSAEALAAVQDLPDADAIRAEIYWRARDWARLAAAGDAALPHAGKLSDVAQAIVLRHAIALAMLGREDALSRLQGRYAAAFATLPTAPTFALLTARVGTVDPATLGKAMAALPSASPAGDVGDLIATGAAAMERTR